MCVIGGNNQRNKTTLKYPATVKMQILSLESPSYENKTHSSTYCPFSSRLRGGNCARSAQKPTVGFDKESQYVHKF